MPCWRALIFPVPKDSKLAWRWVSQCSQNKRSRSGQELPKKANHYAPLTWFLLCSVCISYAVQEKYLCLIVPSPAQHGPDSQEVPRKVSLAGHLLQRCSLQILASPWLTRS